MNLYPAEFFYTWFLLMIAFDSVGLAGYFMYLLIRGILRWSKQKPPSKDYSAFIAEYKILMRDRASQRVNDILTDPLSYLTIPKEKKREVKPRPVAPRVEHVTYSRYALPTIVPFWAPEVMHGPHTEERTIELMEDHVRKLRKNFDTENEVRLEKAGERGLKKFLSHQPNEYCTKEQFGL